MKLALNGINCGALMSAGTSPKETTREIGDTSQAANGQTVTTRLTRKKDLAFSTVPLTHANAHAWAALISGEGEAWSFDASLYGSKGTGPSAATNTTQSAGAAKHGAGKMTVGATTGTITWAGVARNEFGVVNGWTVKVWRYEGAAFVHYLVRSDGAKWVDGVRNDAASTTWLTVNGTSGDVTIANSTGSGVIYDDLVVLPFLVPDDWPAQIHTADDAAANSALPYLNATGDFVAEQTTRVVLGSAEDATIIKTASTTLKTLAVELVAK